MSSDDFSNSANLDDTVAGVSIDFKIGSRVIRRTKNDLERQRVFKATDIPKSFVTAFADTDQEANVIVSAAGVSEETEGTVDAAVDSLDTFLYDVATSLFSG